MTRIAFDLKKLAELYRRARSDPVYFAERFLKLKPFEYQKEFLRDNSPRICCCCGRQVGKTTIAAVKALHFTYFNRGTSVIVVSSSLRQSMILFEKVCNYVQSSPVLRVMASEPPTKTKLVFWNGSHMVALPCGRTGFSLRGFTADLAILDEANFMPPEVVQNVILPMLIARPNARIVMLSTPWTKNHPFYMAYSRQDLGYRVYKWPSRMSPLVDVQTLELYRRSIDELSYAMEYEAEFVDEQNAYFPSSLIFKCIDGEYNLLNPDSIPQDFAGELFSGLDLGKAQDYSVIAIVKREGSALKLIYLKQFPLNTPYAMVVGFIKTLTEKISITRGFIDCTGLGAPITEEIQSFARQLEGITLTAKAKQEVFSNLKLTMEQGRLTIPNERTLITQINEQTYTLDKQGQITFSHPARGHDDQLVALALAVYASHSTPAPPTGKGVYFVPHELKLPPRPI